MWLRVLVDDEASTSTDVLAGIRVGGVRGSAFIRVIAGSLYRWDEDWANMA
jgi:hypothetical protein